MFLSPLPEVLEDPPYYSFYRPKGSIVTIKDMEFESPLDIIYTKVNLDRFNKHKRGAYYKTNKYQICSTLIFLKINNLTNM